ncbi:MAG: GntR family transcriptional regulator [Bacteroidales bacterium]|nr:GntR family transcriptional regulator [Bacteroidales bacterium]
MQLGRYNTLEVRRIVDFGAYLADDEGNEVLLPSRYLTEVPKIGAKMDVFVYTDSEDRPVATTERPFAQVGEVAFLQVAEVNRIGAFLDWGLMKDLLVPYREQKYDMKQGGVYPVYLFVDDASGRVTATAKIEKYLGNVFPTYRKGDKVKALILQHTERGYKAVVDNLHYGMIYHNELYRDVAIGNELEAYVKQVRDNGKIDLTLNDYVTERIPELAHNILGRIRANGGYIQVTDRSTPEEIKQLFHCSKKDFKKAVGALYKEHLITIEEAGLRASV